MEQYQRIWYQRWYVERDVITENNSCFTKRIAGRLSLSPNPPVDLERDSKK